MRIMRLRKLIKWKGRIYKDRGSLFRRRINFARDCRMNLYGNDIDPVSHCT